MKLSELVDSVITSLSIICITSITYYETCDYARYSIACDSPNIVKCSKS